MPVDKVKGNKRAGVGGDKDPLLKLKFDLTSQMIQLPHRLQSPLRNILVTLNSNHRSTHNRTALGKATQQDQPEGLLGKTLLQMGRKSQNGKAELQ
jgi:hypothetical protein